MFSLKKKKKNLESRLLREYMSMKQWNRSYFVGF